MQDILSIVFTQPPELLKALIVKQPLLLLELSAMSFERLIYDATNYDSAVFQVEYTVYSNRYAVVN